MQITNYLKDILDAIELAERFVSEITIESFKDDPKTFFASCRALEIIGEAASKIDKKFQEENKEVPWAIIIGMRNKLIHDYMGADKDIVWNTIMNDLPELKLQIQKLLKEN